jgi:hypothetical protein
MQSSNPDFEVERLDTLMGFQCLNQATQPIDCSRDSGSEAKPYS